MLLASIDSSSNTSSASSTSSYTSLSSSPTPANPANIDSLCRPTPRRIRFAPLPEPRRALLIADDGAERPSEHSSPALDPLSQDTSSLSSFASSKRSSDSTDPSSTPGTATPASLTNTTPSDYDTSAPASPSSIAACLPTHLPLLNPQPPKLSSSPSSGWPKSRGLSLFRPFKRSSGSSSSSSSLSLTPTPSIERTSSSSAQRKGISTEEILTLGTINLFRTSSRESNRENDPISSSGGWGLSRWSSTGGGSTAGAKPFGSPLARTQSTQSYKSPTPSLLSGGNKSSSNSKSKPPIRKGTRMLNGRVYGGPKRPPNANPFANARDEEPEFVEWGYGGMGSVKGAKSAGVSGAGWERLHGSVMNGDGKRPDGVGGDADEEADDGSGMGWVKRRREAREKKEMEEREAKEAAKGTIEGLSKDKPSEASNEPTTAASESTLSTITESATSTPTASTPDVASATPPYLVTNNPPSSPVPPSREILSPFSQALADEEHVFKTLTVPMPAKFHHHHHHGHGHHRGHSRGSSREAILLNPTMNGEGEVEEKEGYTDSKDINKMQAGVESSESDSDSEDGSDSGERGDDDDSDDEDEEDEEQQEQRRKTALGAGVEKISWHKTEVEESI